MPQLTPTAAAAAMPRPATPSPDRMPVIAVLGAGPTGLEAGLAAAQRGWPAVVYEQAPHVAGYVRQWGHVRMFTPWSLNRSPRQRAILDAAGDEERCPTGREYADYLDRVAALLPDVRLSTRVELIGRDRMLKNEHIAHPRRNDAPFRLLIVGPDGREAVRHADVVLDCTGIYGHPNPTGSGGILAPGERACEDRIIRAIPQITPEWADGTTLLVGAGFSAQTAARELAALRAPFTWAVRASEPTWGAVPDDPLPDRAALARSSRRIAAGAVPTATLLTGVVVESMRPAGTGVAVTLSDRSGTDRIVRANRMVSLTGAVGDSRLYRQLQVHECYATEGPISLAATLLDTAGGDCLNQNSAGVDTLRNPEPRFFVLGSKSYGRNSSFLLRVGWQQVEEVFAALDAELPAPRDVSGDR